MLLRNLFESANKTAVLGWGRGMGHKGHMLLAQAVIHHAAQIHAEPFFVVSRTSVVDPSTGDIWADRAKLNRTKDDPLTPDEKLATYKKVFPDQSHIFSVASEDATKLEQVIAKLVQQGFKNIVLVVGEQETSGLSYLTKPDKSGTSPMQQIGLNDLQIISRQTTKATGSDISKPDYQEGPRATPMRQILLDPSKSEEEQFAIWRRDMPDNLSDEEVMNLMQTAKARLIKAHTPAVRGKKAVEEQGNYVDMFPQPNIGGSFTNTKLEVGQKVKVNAGHYKGEGDIDEIEGNRANVWMDSYARSFWFDLSDLSPATGKPVSEGTSIDSTLRAIINDIGEPITNVYDTMKFQAKKYMENHGELGRGFRMVAAGVGGRWVQNMYIGRLHNELHDLCKYNTRRTVDLRDFLRGEESDGEIEMKRSFGNLANNLPPILAKLGEQLNAPQLTRNARRWMQNKAEYERYLMDLEAESNDEPDNEPMIKPPKSNVVGQQNAQVDQIVNDVLSKIPKNIAGEIRNAIARAPNKLAALKQELDRHHVKMAEDTNAMAHMAKNLTGHSSPIAKAAAQRDKKREQQSTQSHGRAEGPKWDIAEEDIYSSIPDLRWDKEDGHAYLIHAKDNSKLVLFKDGKFKPLDDNAEKHIKRMLDSKQSMTESNHWYDAGVKDAQRDAKLYPDRKVKKLNPRTYLPTLKDKQAKHPEEVEQYSQGYRSVKPGVAEGHGAMDLATMDKISHRVKAWNNADRNVEQLITQGHTIKFYPDKIEIFKGGELLYSKDGNFSNVSNGMVVRAKNLVSNLIYKSKQGVAEGKVINTYLWHGSRQKIPMLEPRQSVDTGGAAGSNQNAIYATSDPKVAIAMGLTTAGSDTGMFPNDPQMVLFSGKIRKGEYVYLHKLPFNGPDGKPQFVKGGNSREFHSIPGVEGIKPIEIKEIPVNKYLNLIRKATPADLKLRKKYMKKQGVAEGSGEAEAYKAHLIKTMPQMMNFLSKKVKGWTPGKEEMLGAIDTAYMVMKHTGDVKQAGKAMMDELNTLHRMSQGQQGVAEARMSAAQRLWNAEQKQRAKSDASLARTPSSIPKPEPKKDEKIAEKIKGADGKACWKGKRYAGTKNGKDICIPVSEDVENIMAALINKIIVNEAISNNQR